MGRTGSSKFFTGPPARALEATRVSPGVVSRNWIRSRGGGRVAAYEVQRFDGVHEMWQNVATAIKTETLLVNQPVVL
ncbi:MAG: hypothetical protein GDA56_09740 [Hormoscilla sp. GM7CHS1pb]|nr:hypothetical protein [Hormoscilla sp. GM7CHS1pb]